MGQTELGNPEIPHSIGKNKGNFDKLSSKLPLFCLCGSFDKRGLGSANIRNFHVIDRSIDRSVNHEEISIVFDGTLLCCYGIACIETKPNSFH